MTKHIEQFIDGLTASERRTATTLLTRADLFKTDQVFVGTQDASRLSGLPVVSLQTAIKRGKGPLLPAQTDERGRKLYRVEDIRGFVSARPGCQVV